jgi:hypothetical protein
VNRQAERDATQDALEIEEEKRRRRECAARLLEMARGEGRGCRIPLDLLAEFPPIAQTALLGLPPSVAREELRNAPLPSARAPTRSTHLTDLH